MVKNLTMPTEGVYNLSTTVKIQIVYATYGHIMWGREGRRIHQTEDCIHRMTKYQIAITRQAPMTKYPNKLQASLVI